MTVIMMWDLQKSASASIGYAMMMSPNKAKTAVHDCLILALVILVVRMHAVKATPRGQ